jgi:hypothetical protein
MANSIQGTKIKQRNILFRLILICFMGLMMFAILISWREQLLETSDYVELPSYLARHKTAEKQSAIKKHTTGVKQELGDTNNQ